MLDERLGTITVVEFDAWHERACTAMVRREPRLQIGWAAKLLNVYLKTFAYLGGGGRPGLALVVHPPIDGGLWRGLRGRFRANKLILEDTHCVQRIKDIREYSCYQRVIRGCRAAARELQCSLLEVDQLWDGTTIPES